MYQDISMPVMESLPFDVDALLREMSMSKGHTTRPIPAGQTTYRQRIARVTKTNSAGNSPQHQHQRRRALSQRTTKYRSDIYPYPPQALHQFVLNGHEASMNMTPARPMSWHPSTVGYPHMASFNHMYPDAMPYAVHALEHRTIEVNGLPTPLTKSEVGTDIPMDMYMSLDGRSSFIESAKHHSLGNFACGFEFDETVTNIGASLEQPSSYNQPVALVNSDSPAQPPSIINSQMYADSLRMTETQTAPPTPDLLPIQKPQDDVIEEPDLPPLQRQDSIELIGMGLYDEPIRHLSSTGGLLGSGFEPDLEMECTGKGLKLEETWEPPEDDDDESDGGEDDADGEEGDVETDSDGLQDDQLYTMNGEAESSTDQGERPQLRSSIDLSTCDAFLQMHEDLSNQSFFLDHSDDCYAGVGVGQSMSILVQAMQGQVVGGRGAWM